MPTSLSLPWPRAIYGPVLSTVRTRVSRALIRQAVGMRTLVILRHAKAEPGDGLGDVDRTLTQRGQADAAAAGGWLAAGGYRPDLVLCSPARRTRQTWQAMAIEVAPSGASPTVRYEPALYQCGTEEVFELLREVPPEFGVTLLVGHNPTVSRLSAMLDPEATRDSDGLSTSGIAVHTWDGLWSDCRPGAGVLLASHTARG
ncbi:MAG: histidine phosphatase family protein [Micromonosporaceae bacterium]|nr:histidine phosphatase family protein [Micromonosporaceae bacterium]